MMSLLFFAALILSINASSESNEWLKFKLTYKKTYENVKEESRRLAIFQENIKEIEDHNEKFVKGLVSYTLGINQFTDMSQAEFLETLNYNNYKETKAPETFKSTMNSDIPDEINWTNAGAVTEVKDQGSCGSCWSFSTTGSLEGQYFLKTSKLVSLSEQNLVDCTLEYGEYGCEGGLMDYAFKYVRDNGIMSEKTYPYEGLDETCRYNDSNIVFKITSFADITPSSEKDLKTAVATVGPISVAVNAEYFSMYSGGIFDNANCGNDSWSLNHAVVAVGYGTEDGVDYWLIKNSWGTTWGENGYMRIVRNKNNQCGIATQASYPIM